MFTEFGKTDDNMLSRKGKLAVSHATSTQPPGERPEGEAGEADGAAAGAGGADEELNGDGDHEADILHR